MSDILVRVPKSQLAHFWGDKANAPAAFWRFHQQPKRLSVGDYVFFTQAEGVVAGVKVSQIVPGDDMLAEFGFSDGDPGNWNVCWEVMVALTPQRTVGIQWSGRGYRYASGEEQKMLRRLMRR